MTISFDRLPNHWDTTRLDWVATVNARIGWKALTAAEYQDSGYAFLATPNIKGREIDFTNVNYISDFRYRESPELQLVEGDVLLTKDGFTLGTVNIVRNLPRPATVNGSIAVLRPFGTHPSFLYYVIASSVIQGHIWSVKDGMDVLHLFQRDIKKFPLPLPPLDEQHRIADFLDAETGRIDRLTVARDRQMTLAFARLDALAKQETGRTFIRPATKSFEDWPIFPLRRAISAIKTGATPSGSGPELRTDESQLNGIPWYGPSSFEGLLRLGLPTKNLPRDVVAERVVPLFPKGSVLIVGIGATAGKVAYLDHDASGNQQVTALTPERGVSGEFLAWQLWAATRELRDMAPYTTLPIINNDYLKSFPIALPSAARQQEVVRKLNRAAEHVGALQAAALRASDLVRERRQALITAAVTGQFDVSTASGRNVTDGVTA